MTSSLEAGGGHTFDDATLAGVLGHMNGDHGDDNLLIARAFGPEAGMTDAEATAARMTGFDGHGGVWQATRADGSTQEITVPWLGGPISERPEVRREIVALYDEACRRLGIEPRSHA
ncbi:DUF2470 domain-containing protein [Microbacterium sp. M3]|uniref:DUF2470 domain-containing protein n=1 Tax=Microbacterium arthrosphaerae TaxID=792652 RepID=A0ABU4H4B1_9MICO|nr:MULTISPECIES: DUF2470 domain-containing protein [Microbacterium]MDW4574172.1 DUF2470 domain-containing protein [Microbacterium arthrosphaerae]MDW7608027.1 DUF2470 domain-containing protein [Microbacterium sp. M3]